MPGYLIKTANFVAEIANDEELTHLAEVDTIKKDSQICVLPNNTWIEAKKIPILRKVWGLDAGPSVPPPIKMDAPSVSPIKTKLPPSLKTVVSSNPLYIVDEDVTARNLSVPNVEAPVSESSEPVEDTPDRASDTIDEKAARIESEASDCQVLNSEVVLSLDESEDESLDIRAITAADGSSLTFDVEKFSELSNVSHTWVADNGFSTSDLSHTDLEREVREANMQVLDDLSGIEMDAVGGETVVQDSEFAKELREEHAESTSENEASASGQHQRNMSADEYIEASPEEATYVIESKMIEEKHNAAAAVETDLSESVEIAFQASGEHRESVMDDPSNSLEQIYDSRQHAEVCALENDVEKVKEPARREGTSPMGSRHNMESCMDDGGDERDASEFDEEEPGDRTVAVPRAERSGLQTDAIKPIVLENSTSSVAPFRSQDKDAQQKMVDQCDVSENVHYEKSNDELLEEAEREVKMLMDLDSTQSVIEPRIEVSGAYSVPECRIDLEDRNEADLDSGKTVPASKGVKERAEELLQAPGFAMEYLETGDSPAVLGVNQIRNVAESSHSVNRAPSAEDVDDLFATIQQSSESYEGVQRKGFSTETSLRAAREAREEVLPYDEPVQAEPVQAEPVREFVQAEPVREFVQAEPVPEESAYSEQAVRNVPRQEYPGDRYENGVDMRGRGRGRRITHRPRNGRLYAGMKEQGRDRRRADAEYYDQQEYMDRYEGQGMERSTYSQEFVAARDAVEAAIRAASMNGGVDERVLRRAVSFVDALDDVETDVFRAEMLGRIREMESVEEEDDSPSDIFRIRNRRDLNLSIEPVARVTETSPTFRHYPANRMPARDCLDYVDEECSSDRLKVRGRSELRRLIVAEQRAADMDSIQNMNAVTTEDYCRKNGSELRKLFEKQDELHLFLGNGVREEESAYASAMGTVEDEANYHNQMRSDITQDSVTAGMPVRNNAIVAAPVERKVAEPTKITAAPTRPNEHNKENDVSKCVADFIENRLYDGEERIADFDTLHLTNMRLFKIEEKGDTVLNYEAFDIENVQPNGIVEDKNPTLFFCDLVATFVFAILVALTHKPIRYVMIFALIYVIIMLPVCFICMHRRRVKCSSNGRSIACKCSIGNGNREAAMRFLNSVDEAKQVRKGQISRR